SELVPQRPESHAAQVERIGVELLQVEGGAVALARVGAGLEPDPLADLVADGLARPTEVTIDLALHEVDRLAAAFDDERERELRCPRLADVLRLARRDRQLEVHPDVDDHTHGPHRLGAEHPELVRGILEIPELAHESLGVQRPSLAVPREESERALE